MANPSTPLPPYIHTPLQDVERYQTVHARVPGSAVRRRL